MSFYKSFAAFLFCSSVHANSATDIANLRQAYSKPLSEWPAVNPLATGKDLAPLPELRQLSSKEKQLAALGEKLFFDPILSKDKTVSCASCHQPHLMFSDARTVGVGVRTQAGNRNTPALFHLELWQSFFWDGRSPTLQHQVLQPIHNPIEMDLSLEQAISRLANSPYAASFASVFSQQPLNQAQLALALSTYASRLTLPETATERLLRQASTTPNANQTSVLTDQELLGLHLFRTKAGCINCHNGPLLSDNQFHVTGLHFYGRRFEDLGRYLHTGNPTDAGKFRTPSLRAVSKTGPWMHNGLFTQFEGIVSFYNGGGARPKIKPQAGKPVPEISPLLHKLNLTKDERAALSSFLVTL